MSADPTPRGNPRLQRNILRIAALVSVLAIPGVLTPRWTLRELSALLRLGPPPDFPLLTYLLAGGSCVFLAEAMLLWIISCDVQRYQPLVVFSAWFFLAGAPLFLWIDSQAGLPTWWVAMDATSCLAAGTALLWACYGPRPPA